LARVQDTSSLHRANGEDRKRQGQLQTQNF